MVMTSQEVRIRPVERSELRTCEAIMGEVFEFEDIDIIPAWQMHSSSRHGGIVLGAFTDERMVGFSFAYPAYDGRPYLFSSGLFVLAEYESRGIGYRLKVEQGRQAIARGYQEIVWTVEPLNSRAIYLYMKLGATLVEYEREMYDELNLGGVDAGIVADEVVVRWLVPKRIPGPSANRAVLPLKGIPCLTESTPMGEHRRLTSAGTSFEPCDPARLEIPWDLTGLKAHSLEAAFEWRFGVRALMEKLFEIGYLGVDLVLDKSERRSYIVFSRSARP